MSRHTTAAVDSAFASSQIDWRILADISVTSTTLYVCTGNRYLYVSPNTYGPVHTFGTVDPVREESDAFPRGIKMRLALVNSQAIFEVFNESLFNRTVKVYKAAITQTMTGPSVVGTPQCIFKGRINHCGGEVGGDNGSYFEIEVESRLRREAQANYYNRETLWQTYSGDTFCNYVDKIPLYRSQWGNLPSPGIGLYVGGNGANPGAGGAGGGGGGMFTNPNNLIRRS